VNILSYPTSSIKGGKKKLNGGRVQKKILEKNDSYFSAADSTYLFVTKGVFYHHHCCADLVQHIVVT
jgi:hypothetical protein